MTIKSSLKQIAFSALLLGASHTVYADGTQLEAGKELYAEFCAKCHGENKTGLTTFTDDPTKFTDRLEGMTEEMPDFAGFFEEDEIAAMYAYLAATESSGE